MKDPDDVSVNTYLEMTDKEAQQHRAALCRKHWCKPGAADRVDWAFLERIGQRLQEKRKEDMDARP